MLKHGLHICNSYDMKCKEYTLLHLLFKTWCPTFVNYIITQLFMQASEEHFRDIMTDTPYTLYWFQQIRTISKSKY